MSHESPRTGGVAGDEGTLGGTGERQHRRGGQAGSHDVGAAPSAGFAAGKGAEPLPFVGVGFTSAVLVLCGWKPFRKRTLFHTRCCRWDYCCEGLGKQA